MLTNTFNIIIPLPLVNIMYWRAPWRLLIQLPKGLQSWYAVTDWMEAGLVMRVLNLNYGLHGGDPLGKRFSWVNISTGPAARFYLYRGAYFQINAGSNIGLIGLTDSDGGLDRTIIWDGWFVKLSIGYTL